MMSKRAHRLFLNNATTTLLALLMIWPISGNLASARDGDTLAPISIPAPMLVTWPKNLFTENDFSAIEGRVLEARNSGVPLAVRVIDTSLPVEELPLAVGALMPLSAGEPFSDSRLSILAESWVNSESIETNEGADDGILLLVLVPVDRTQTQAVWWIGPNALPLNGLTQKNILATAETMRERFEAGNIALGVYEGLLEFGYNIQFGVPHVIQRTEAQSVLHRVMGVYGAVLAACGVGIVALAGVLSWRKPRTEVASTQLSIWQAAALKRGRATPGIAAAMIVDLMQRNMLQLSHRGGWIIAPNAEGDVASLLRTYATDDGHLPASLQSEFPDMIRPVLVGMEDDLAVMGAMTIEARTDATWMHVAMSITAALAAIGVVPSIASMSRLGVAGVAIAVVGILFGWWWLNTRRYTTSGGEKLLNTWLESASPEDLTHYRLAVDFDQITEIESGPQMHTRIQVMRQLRGLSAS